MYIYYVYTSIAIIAFGIKDDGFALATGFTVGIWGVVVIAVHMKVNMRYRVIKCRPGLMCYYFYY